MSDDHKNGGPDAGLGARRVAEVPSTLPVSHALDVSVRRVLVIAGERVSSHALPESGDFRIGRGEDAQLRIEDPSVSREHAALHFERNKPIFISDAGSSNGT